MGQNKETHESKTAPLPTMGRYFTVQVGIFIDANIQRAPRGCKF